MAHVIYPPGHEITIDGQRYRVLDEDFDDEGVGHVMVELVGRDPEPLVPVLGSEPCNVRATLPGGDYVFCEKMRGHRDCHAVFDSLRKPRVLWGGGVPGNGRKRNHLKLMR